MKHLFQCISAGLLAAVLASIPVARAQQPPPGPDRLALQKWYLFSQTQPAPLSFNEILAPCGMAFDGENMWVGDRINQTLTRIRAADAAVIGVYPVPLASLCPMVFDGANIWVLTAASGSPTPNGVTKIRPDGEVVTRTFPPSTQLIALAFDGTNIWVSGANAGATGADAAALLKLSPEAEVVESSNSPVFFGNIIFDGSSLWVTEQQELREMRPSDGSGGSYFPFGDSHSITGLVFDGTYIWVANNDGVMAKVRRSDGAVLATFAVGRTPKLAFDGRNIWAISLLTSPSGTVFTAVWVWHAATGELAGFLTLPGIAAAFAFDGTSMWIGCVTPAGIFKL